MKKTRALWRWLRPKKKDKQKLHDDDSDGIEPPPGRVNRTLSTEEAMRARIGRANMPPRRRSTQVPAPSHPHIQQMLAKTKERRQSGLSRMKTLPDEETLDGEKEMRAMRGGDAVIEIREP